jgi:hypothetical protein
LRKKAKRFSTNMISSVTNQGKVRWMIYRETLTCQVFIRFLQRLIKDSKKKVFLIVDNLRVHDSAQVKRLFSHLSPRCPTGPHKTDSPAFDAVTKMMLTSKPP